MLDHLPPQIVRRLVLAPLILFLCINFLGSAVLILAIALIIDISSPGDWRTTRIVLFVVAYVALEVIGLISLFVLWVLSGFGAWMNADWMVRRNYGFMRWWFRMMNGVVRKLFHVRVVIEDRPEPRPGPICVFCRHAGPGNSLLLIGTLLVGYRRKPRIVMLAKLQWEPMFDIMLNRLPNRFITHDPARRDTYLEAIGELTADLDDDGAFVLFPEGKDFTPRIRDKAIEGLRSKGHHEAADRAERLEYMLPPRHNGVRAALAANPNTDIVFVAHALLEEVGSFRELWARIPFERPVVARYWRVPHEDFPEGEAETIDWLYKWWETIDAWIVERTAQPLA